MRKVVFQMMTTLNGRLDDPDAWVSGVSDDLYREINRVYETIDTILVGQQTYEDMISYWPSAGTGDGGSEINKSMAHKMNSYKKIVFSTGSKKKKLKWNNAEQVLMHNDEDISQFIHGLKAQPGDDILHAGGARFAQSLICLGLVDVYHFFIYPRVSAGATWFEQLQDKHSMEFLSATAYENGFVGLYYKTPTV
jgi:dihydrofolate reductase